MRSLLLRQARLLLVPALISASLGLLVLALMLLTDEAWRPYRLAPADLAFGLVVLCAPWLLGVACVAPDGETGGLTFLSSLPLRPTRHLLLRVGVAAGYSAAVVTPFALAADLPRSDQLVLLLGGALGLAAGVGAGCAVRRSLAAFVVAPLLVAASLGAYEAFAGWLVAPSGFGLAARLVAIPALLLAGWAAFRDPGREARGPALRAAAVLGVAVALGVGVTSAARAAALAYPEHDRGFEVDARGFAIIRDAWYADWPGAGDPTVVTTLLRREELVEGPFHEQGARGWRLDGSLGVASRRGDRVLAWEGSGQLVLLDVAARRIVARGPMLADAARPRPQAWPDHVGFDVQPDAVTGLAAAAGWEGDEAWVALADGRIVAADGGRTLATLPSGSEIEACGGTRLLLRIGSGAALFDVRDGGCEPLERPAGGLGLSPGGRVLVRWRGPQAIELTDLERGVAMTVEVPGPAPRKGTWAEITFSPDEQRALVSWPPTGAIGKAGAETSLRLADLRTGSVADAAVPVGWRAVTWSPDGCAAAAAWGWLDLTSGRYHPLVGGYARAVWFADDRTLMAVRHGYEVERVGLRR